MVSSPAIVPTTAALSVESIAAQTAFAMPLRVFITTMFCARSMDVTEFEKSWAKLERKSSRLPAAEV